MQLASFHDRSEDTASMSVPRHYRGVRISVVIPCLNEEPGLAKVLAEVPVEVDEILVLDNCSSDATVEVALAGGERVRVVCHPENLGYGGSYLRGLSMASGDVVVTTDGDGTYPVRECLRLVDDLLDGGLDFLSASRFPLYERRCMSGRNRFGNWVLNTAILLLHGVRLRDGQSGMWIFRKDVLDRLDLYCTGMEFSNEIKMEAFTRKDVRASEVRIPYAERVGTSKLFPFRDGMRMISYLLRRRLLGPDAAPLGASPTAGPSTIVTGGVAHGFASPVPSLRSL